LRAASSLFLHLLDVVADNDFLEAVEAAEAAEEAVATTALRSRLRSRCRFME
jgi:hypothetical protein